MERHYCLFKNEESREVGKSGRGKEPGTGKSVDDNQEKQSGQLNKYPPYSYGTPWFLFWMLRQNDPVPFRRWRVVLLYTLKSLLMLTFSLGENLFFSKKIGATSIPESPVFIIGHYRSGTTFLHKVLSADRQWSHITTFDFLFPYLSPCLVQPMKAILSLLIRTFKIKHPHFNNYIVNLDDPLEEDMITISSLTPHSAFWGEVFPHRAKDYFCQQMFFRSNKEKEAWKQGYLYLLKKFTCRKKGRLLLKNPPNTARVRTILELFPDAKFIFIYRNPYQVFYSTQSLWKRTLEKHYMLQQVTDEEREEIILWHYEHLMGHYEQDRSLIPPGNLAEVRFETFESDPFTETARIYRELNLNGFERAKTEIRKQLEQEKDYRKYSYTYDDQAQDRIEKRWGRFIRQWNYERLK
jgi:hypothetical protein